MQVIKDKIKSGCCCVIVFNKRGKEYLCGEKEKPQHKGMGFITRQFVLEQKKGRFENRLFSRIKSARAFHIPWSE